MLLISDFYFSNQPEKKLTLIKGLVRFGQNHPDNCSVLKYDIQRNQTDMKKLISWNSDKEQDIYISKYLPTEYTLITKEKKYHLNQIIEANIISNEMKSNLLIPDRMQWEHSIVSVKVPSDT